VRQITIDLGAYVEEENRRQRRGGLAVAGATALAALLLLALPRTPPPVVETSTAVATTTTIVTTVTTATTATITATTPTTPAPAPAKLALPAALSFPMQLAGTVSAAQLVQIRNSGDEPLTIAAIRARGDAFRTSNDCPPKLEKKASCSATVVFAPVVAGPQRGELTIETSGGTKAVAFTGVAQPFPALDLGQIDFGSATADTPRPPRTVRFANKRRIAIAFGNAALSGPFATAADRCSGARVEPGSDCDVTVALTATAPGTFRGELRLVDAHGDAVAGGTLSAETTPRVVEVPPAKIDVAPHQIAFTRTSRTKRDVVLTNRGGKATTVGLAINGISFGFVVDTKACNGKMLSPGESCTFPVTALPIAFENGSSMRILVSYDGHTENAAVVAK